MVFGGLVLSQMYFRVGFVGDKAVELEYRPDLFLNSMVTDMNTRGYIGRK